MKWSIQELSKHQESPLSFEENFSLEELIKARDKDILGLSTVQVKGFLLAKKEEYLLHYHANYTIILPSSRSLKPVSCEQAIHVEEVFMEEEVFNRLAVEEKSEEILFTENQSISLEDSVADNILLNIPLQVLTPDEEQSNELPKGEEWVVVSEEEFGKKERQKALDASPFAKLSELFKED